MLRPGPPIWMKAMIRAILSKREEDGAVLLFDDTEVTPNSQMIYEELGGVYASAICASVVMEGESKVAVIDWASLRPTTLDNWYLDGILEMAVAAKYGTEEQYDAVLDDLDVFWYDVVLGKDGGGSNLSDQLGWSTELLNEDQSWYRPNQEKYPKAPEKIRVCDLVENMGDCNWD